MTFIGLFFSFMLLSAIFGMAKIQRQELLEARAKKAAQKARIDALRPKCYRPDGD